jgi:hypothetical protein
VLASTQAPIEWRSLPSLRCFEVHEVPAGARICSIAFGVHVLTFFSPLPQLRHCSAGPLHTRHMQLAQVKRCGVVRKGRSGHCIVMGSV